MKNILASILATLALTASAEYIRQATETYPGGSTIRDYTTTNAVKDIVANEGYIKSDALNGYATETWVEGKGYVTESVTNGILTAAKAHADQYANQAPDYANVSNLASTAIQTHQSLSATNDYIRLDGTSVMTGLLRADKGVYVGSHSVILGTKGIGSVSAGDYITYNGSESTYEFGWYTFPTNSYSFLFNGSDDDLGIWPQYGTHGNGTFNVNPVGGLSGFWIGETNLESIVDVKTSAATNALATVAHTGSYNDLTDRPAAGGITTNDVKNIVSDMSIDTISNKASGAYIKYDLSAHLDASTAAWVPNGTPVPESPTFGSTYYSRVHWHGLTWACEKYLYSSGMWSRIDEHAMMSGSSLDINATDLEFPDGTPTKRTINTKLATTNDLGSVILSAKEYADQYANQAPDYATVSNKAMNAEQYTDDKISDYNITTVKPIHTSVTNLQAYLGGQNVRVSVTNYNSTTELPRLRIEENVSNNWNTVWDENDKFDLFKTNITDAVAVMTNDTIQTVRTDLAIGLATKAPLAWGDVTSSGYDAPTSNTVWMSGRTVFSGDTEFKTVQVGSGVVGFCVSKGVQAYTGGDPGQFKFTTDDGRFYFGMNIMDAYVLGCDCSNIVVTAVAGNQIVTLRYDVTMTGKPCIYYTPSLEPGFTWEKLSDSMGNPVPGASHVVSWEAAPPAGHEILYCNCGTDPKGFFKAVIEVAADNTFFTNLEADLRGGIRCTNEFLGIRNIIEPYIDDVSLTVKWRVKP